MENVNPLLVIPEVNLCAQLGTLSVSADPWGALVPVLVEAVLIQQQALPGEESHPLL